MKEVSSDIPAAIRMKLTRSPSKETAMKTDAIVKSVALFSLLLLTKVDSRAESWRGIVPLKSTRADVERLLGKPIPGDLAFQATYRLPKKEVLIRYAAKQFCRDPQTCGCRVPDDTVLDITVTPKHAMKFATLGVDKARFETFPLAEDIGILIYRDDLVGLIYAVRRKDDQVLGVSINLRLGRDSVAG